MEIKRKKKAFFITVEGCEGSGKTTQAKLLKEYLQEKGIEVILTREPGGSVVAEQIRNILLNPEYKVSSVCELMLYEAARAQHLEEIIKPNLKKDVTVICDRFTDSTLAYQGYGRGLDKKMIEYLNAAACGKITPDLTLYLDVNPKDGLKRAASVDKGSLTGGDRIEKESINFHNKVRQGFLELAQKYPERIKKIDTKNGIEETHKNIVEVIKDLIYNV